jgi:hypothetical protein
VRTRGRVEVGELRRAGEEGVVGRRRVEWGGKQRIPGKRRATSSR